eukprot:TRINITY_DN11185_c0_g1::TRINITY_DN11185_c0_g1_i1::g.6633::m.6633 TRINITY_DN11185_c0_g1::TRINITY_DN11185_c0_g1_i1::g.6633  ORF type:complete len:102 (+),score=25.58,sp/A8ZU47/CH10_DESOH/53.41/9e-27,Cpn10/PF00166.16/1.7e-29 TRINITY_DN11185_c0_g1_i1:75-380(+)
MSQAAKRLIPLLDRVLVKRVQPPTKSAGGILLPEQLVDKKNEATVISVGAGAFGKNGERLPVDVKSGDKVLISEYGGTPVKMDGEEYLLIRNDDILAKYSD